MEEWNFLVIYGGFWWTNWSSKRNARFLDILDSELKNTNKELDEGLSWGRRALGAAWGLHWSSRLCLSPVHSMLLFCFCDCVLHGAALPKCSHPHPCLHAWCSLDCFALSLHATLPHLIPWESCKTRSWLPSMFVLCMCFDDKCWSDISWCIMVHVWLGEPNYLHLIMF
jgi:hypothetical protein